MTDEVWAYFQERYTNSEARVVPWHWPDFKSKEEVDEWITLLSDILKALLKGVE